MLQFGQQYCTAGKKYRMFKKKDPKIYPPNWCPKLKSHVNFVFMIQGRKHMVLAHPTQTQIASRRVPVRRAVIWDSKLDSFSILFHGEAKRCI